MTVVRGFGTRAGKWSWESSRWEVLAAGRAWATGQQRLVRAVTALDSSGEWALDGARTCAHWVAEALDVEVCTAREWLRVGHALTGLGTIDRAFSEGRLSYTKVRTLTRVATPDSEAELCELAERVAAARLAPALARWLSRRETPEQTERRHHEARSLSWRMDPYGMIAGTFRLPPLQGAVVTSGIEAIVMKALSPTARAVGGEHASADAASPRSVAWPSFAQQRADALVELARSGGTRVVTEIVLHVRGDGCTLDDGTPVPSSVIEKVAPESFIRALIHDAERRPINASSRRRHPTARQRRVIRERDRVCVDCGTTENLVYDHDPEYSKTGHTLVEETELRCGRCHRLRHEKLEGAA